LRRVLAVPAGGSDHGGSPEADKAWCTVGVADLVPRCGVEYEGAMGKQSTVVLYVLALVAVVVGLDVLFFRNHFWVRLTVNVGIVLVFTAFYFRFLKRS
jgi:uncharacterized protein (DUF983 family)